MIGDLRKDPIFRMEMEEIRKKHRPEPMIFHPEKPISIEKWKYDSGVIAGFDLLYSMLVANSITEKPHE